MERSFRLASLLRLRKITEDDAAARLGAASASRMRADAQRTRAVEELCGHQLGSDVGVSTWRASAAARAALRQNLLAATALSVTAAARVAERETEWQAARARSVPLEKLEERHDERVVTEDLRLEQIELDEVASRRAAQTSTDHEEGQR